MEVIALIMVAFAALLAVERKSEDAPPSRSDGVAAYRKARIDGREGDLENAYYRCRRAAREGILVRGRFKITGKHGDYRVREKLPTGCATHGSIYTLRQAKEWLWCLHNDFDYEACKRAYRNGLARRSRRVRQKARDFEERRRDLAVQAAEMGFHDFSEDEQGRRTYYPSETFPRYYGW